MKEFIVPIADEGNISFVNNDLKLQELVRCKDCKYRSYYCTEDVNGETLYSCHHPCASNTPRSGNWFCAEGERKDGDKNG